MLEQCSVAHVERVLTISRIESGRHATSVTTLRRLAAAFETHLVVGFEDEPDKATGAGLVAVS